MSFYPSKGGDRDPMGPDKTTSEFLSFSHLDQWEAVQVAIFEGAKEATPPPKWKVTGGDTPFPLFFTAHKARLL